MGQLGLGVMINRLGGNSETVEALQKCLGQKIKSVWLADNELKMDFNNGLRLRLFDDGQSCCESRYMVTDDDLTYFTNTIFKDIEIKDAPSHDTDGWGDHDVQFLEITTGKGSFVMSNHNEHNGYYGGFAIVARCYGRA